MPRYVINGATLKCTKGSKPAPFACAESTALGGSPGGTVGDTVPGTNIFPFGTCKITKKPCVPLPVAGWDNPAPAIFSVTLPTITASSTVPCATGGTIKVQTPGQGTVNVAAEHALFEKNLNLALANASSQGTNAFSDFAAELINSGVTEVLSVWLKTYGSEIEQNIKTLEKGAESGDIAPGVIEDHLYELNTEKTLGEAFGHGLTVLGNAIAIYETGEELLHGNYVGSVQDGSSIGTSVVAAGRCVAEFGPEAEAAGAETGPGDLLVGAGVGVGCTLYGALSGDAVSKQIDDLYHHPIGTIEGNVEAYLEGGPVGLAAHMFGIHL